MFRNWLAKNIIANHRFFYSLPQGLPERMVIDLTFWSLKQSDLFSIDEIKELQTLRLKKLLKRVFKIPFWRARFDNLNLKSGDIKTLGDLWKLPILTKRDYQEAWKANPQNCFDVSLSADRRVVTMTSGSTGAPLSVVHDKKYLSITNAAINLLTWYRCGVNLSRDKKVIMVNMTAPINEAVYFQKVIALSLNGVSDEIDNLMGLLRQNEPIMLYSSAYQLRRLAGELKASGQIVKFNSILIADETLDCAEIRGLEKIFSAPIFTNYGQREVQNIGTECRFQDGLHIKSQANIVEILDDDGNPVPAGVIGNIVVTSLDNYTMPFIRYKTGDLGHLVSGRCRCGISSPRIKFEGRGAWRVCLPDGNALPFDYVKNKLFSYPTWQKIKLFQFIQKADRRNILYVVPERSWDETDSQEIKHSASLLGISLDIIIVPNIEQAGTRKHREFISQVSA